MEHVPTIPPELGQWINQRLPPEAVWEVRPVDAKEPPYRVIAYDVIITGDRPPIAARAADLPTACRRAVQRYTHPVRRRRRNPKEASHGRQ